MICQPYHNEDQYKLIYQINFYPLIFKLYEL